MNEQIEQRAIPTRVGKSGAGRTYSEADAGHPHAGGEIIAELKITIRDDGPSPRGWGNQDIVDDRGRDRRAIPTRVGKSCCVPRRRLPRSGHPHAGGEITSEHRHYPQGSGPSPRGWGNPASRQSKSTLFRAIPTRVGKSRRMIPRQVLFSGHPHAGGEIADLCALASSEHGPSPRGWGNHRTALHKRPHHRAIPTRVGKSG